MKILLILYFIFMLSACKDSEKEIAPKKKKKTENVTKEITKEKQEEKKIASIYKILFEDEVLTADRGLPIENVKAGDILKITAVVKFIRPLFEDKFIDYHKFYPQDYAEYCRRPLSLRPTDCPDPSYFDFYDGCRLKFRFYAGTQEEDRLISDTPEDSALQLQVGNERYYLDEVLSTEFRTLVATVKVPDTEGMIRLVTAFKSSPLVERIGFLGFDDTEGECPHIGNGYAPVHYRGEFLIEGEDGRPSETLLMMSVQKRVSIKYRITVEVKTTEVKENENI